MYTFTAAYSGTAYRGTSGVAALYHYVLDQVNTPLGSRPYYPDYGSRIHEYRHLPLTATLARVVHTEVYVLLTQQPGVTVLSTSYQLVPEHRALHLQYTILYAGETVLAQYLYAGGTVQLGLGAV